MFVTNALNHSRMFDELVVLDDGMVVEHGPFVELLDKRATFSELYDEFSGPK